MMIALIVRALNESVLPFSWLLPYNLALELAIKSFSSWTASVFMKANEKQSVEI